MVGRASRSFRPGPASAAALHGKVALGLLLLAAGSAPAHAGSTSALCTWTGGSATTSLWSDPANWDACGGVRPTPLSGDALRFPDGAARRSNQNDLAGLSVAQLIVVGPNYVLAGNPLAVAGLIQSNVNASSGADAGPDLALPLSLAAHTSLNCLGNRGVHVSGGVALAAFSLSVVGTCDVEIAGALSGNGTLTKPGPGVLTLSGTGSHAGAVQVAGGVLTLRADPGSILFDLSNGSTLSLEADQDFDAALGLGDGAAAATLQASNSVPRWSGPITLASGATVDVDGSALLTLSGPVGGSGGFVKAGVGQLILAGSNTYTGTTTVGSGVLQVDTGSGFGQAGNLVAVEDGATLELQSGGYAGYPLVLDGNGQLGIGALRSLSGQVLWTGPVVLDADAMTGGQLGTVLQLNGAIGGPGGLVHAGPNELVLAAANTYTGATTINAGTLQVRDPAALGNAAAGTTVAPGGTLALDGPLVMLEPLALNGLGAGAGTLVNLDGDSRWDVPVVLLGDVAINSGPDSLALAGVAGAAGFQKVGPGTLVLSGSNSYGGHTLVVDGILRLQHPGALGSAGAGGDATEVIGGATLQLAGVSVAGEALELFGNGAGGSGALFASGGSNTWGGPITLDSNAAVGVQGMSELALTGPLAGPFGIEKVGAGRLVLGAANSYTGTTSVSAGTLCVAHSLALGSATGSPADSTTVAFGAALELDGPLMVPDESLSLLGDGLGDGALVSLDGDNAWSGNWSIDTFARVGVVAGRLTLGGGVSSAGSLTKVGTGTLEFGGAAPYTAPVTVAQGLLTVQAGAAAADVVVEDMATLGGSGDVEDITLQDGGTLAPRGTLGADSLLWNGGEIDLRLGPTALDSDRLALAGALLQGAGPVWAFRFGDAPAGPPVAGTLYPLVGYASTGFASGEIGHSYDGVPGANSLPGRIVAGATQLSLVPLGVSLFRDGFEPAP